MQKTGILRLFSSVESILFGSSLEFTMTHLRGCIDEFKLDIFEQLSLGDSMKCLSQDQWSLLVTNTVTLDHDEVISDNTIVWESTHWGNLLLSQVVFGGGTVVVTVSSTLSDSVDLLIDFSSMVITVLTSSGNSIEPWMDAKHQYNQPFSNLYVFFLVIWQHPISW